MKTAASIQPEIDRVIRAISNTSNSDTKSMKRLNEKLSHYRQCMFYLQSNPSEHVLKGQVEMLEKRLAGIWEKFSTWQGYNPDKKNARSAFKTAMNIPAIEAQIETLNYLLND